MTKLTNIYGHCIIPNNTILFRGHAETSFKDCMFFTTKKWVAGAFNDKVQVWKTKKEIEVIFLVEYLNKNSWTISALPKLFNDIFPSEANQSFTDLDIKHWDINRRNKLTSQLYDKHTISGWFTSLEDKVELEVCLFNKQANSNQLVLIDTVSRKSKKYLKDSLDKIKIFPPTIFYDRTKKELNQHPALLLSSVSTFINYKRMINAWIKHDMEIGIDRNKSKHSNFNLRLKLKI